MRMALQVLVKNETTKFRGSDVVASGATDSRTAQCVHVAFLEYGTKSCTAQRTSNMGTLMVRALTPLCGGSSAKDAGRGEKQCFCLLDIKVTPEVLQRSISGLIALEAASVAKAV